MVLGGVPQDLDVIVRLAARALRVSGQLLGQPRGKLQVARVREKTCEGAVEVDQDGSWHVTWFERGGHHARTPVILLVHDLNVRIVHATTGELLRELPSTPTPHAKASTRTEPTGNPRTEGSGVSNVPRQDSGGGGGI